VGDTLRLHVRARDVALALRPVEGLSIRNQLRGRLLRLDPVAGSGYVEALVDVEGQHLRARITRLAVEDLALEPGQIVYALVKSASLAAQDGT
jgi:molybdate transport system ATP-binding protein